MGGFGGYQVVSSSKNVEAYLQSHSVSCPSGKIVLGGGCRDEGASRHIKENYPNGQTGWNCVSRDAVFASGGTITVYAICVNAN